MKIIAVGDIHMAPEYLERIPGIGEADLVLLNGDLTNYGGKQEVRQVLNRALEINPHCLAQFGNLDKPEVNSYLEDLGINLHSQARIIDDSLCLVGIGGSNITPFRTPSEFKESDISTMATAAYRQGLEYVALAEPLYKRKIPILLISHTPPYRTKLDRIHSGKHVGSTAIRNLIERYHPDLCVVGHIHEAKGTDSIEDSPIVNPGMLRSGGWVCITIENSQITIDLQ